MIDLRFFSSIVVPKQHMLMRTHVLLLDFWTFSKLTTYSTQLSDHSGSWQASAPCEPRGTANASVQTRLHVGLPLLEDGQRKWFAFIYNKLWRTTMSGRRGELNVFRLCTFSTYDRSPGM